MSEKDRTLTILKKGNLWQECIELAAGLLGKTKIIKGDRDMGKYCSYCNLVIAPAEKTAKGGYHKRSAVVLDCADFAMMTVKAKTEMLKIAGLLKKGLRKTILKAIETISDFQQAKEVALMVANHLKKFAKKERNLFKKIVSNIKKCLLKIWEILNIGIPLAIPMSP